MRHHKAIDIFSLRIKYHQRNKTMVSVQAQIKAKISNADIQGKQVLTTFTPALSKDVKQAFANFVQNFCSKLELFFTWDFYKISTAPEELLQTS